MDGCTNKNLGRMLHDYELGLLSAEDRERFELHLYECDYCTALARDFIDSARIMRHDPEAKAIIEDLAGQASGSSVGRTRKDPFPFTKMLIGAVVMLVLAVPTYLLWLQPQGTDVIQTLELLPIRSGGSDVIYSNKGGDVKIIFFISESFAGKADLLISSVAGDTVVNKPGFSDFNDKGLGSITFPVSMVSDGNYTLTIRPDPETGVEERVYMFRVR